MVMDSGTQLASAFDWEIALELMAKNEKDIDTISSTIIPLNKIQETFQTLLDRSKNEVLRVLVAP